MNGCRGIRQPDRSSEGAARVIQSPAEIEREIFGRVNAYRRSRGLSVLAMDRNMNDQARDHSRWMAKRRNLSHRGSGGRFRELQGEPTMLVAFAENVAYNFGHSHPGEIAVEGWIRSPGHHKNMVGREYQLSGVGAARSRDGSWYLTQLFGRRDGESAGAMR